MHRMMHVDTLVGTRLPLPCRYVLANIETRQGLARGDRVWQIAFGSGFKCNSAVWRALRSTNEQHRAWVGVKVSDSDV